MELVINPADPFPNHKNMDRSQFKLFTFIAFGLISAVYIFSVIEHEDGLGKVCLILLLCLGLTLPVVVLNFNDLGVRTPLTILIR